VILPYLSATRLPLRATFLGVRPLFSPKADVKMSDLASASMSAIGHKRTSPS